MCEQQMSNSELLEAINSARDHLEALLEIQTKRSRWAWLGEKADQAIDKALEAGID